MAMASAREEGTNRDRRRRRRRPRASDGTPPTSGVGSAAARATTLLLLLGARLCRSFVVPPGVAVVPRGSRRSPWTITAAFDSKEGDESDGDAGSEEWEWDGEVVEGAHDMEFESVDDDGKDAFMPSMDFLSMANSVASPALAAAAGGAGGFDPTKNMGKIHRMAMEEGEGTPSEDDLMEMGGDPAFLDGFDDGPPSMGTEDADFFGWDGEVNEDAHFD